MKYAIQQVGRPDRWVESQQGNKVTTTPELDQVMTFDSYSDCESICEGLNSQFSEEMKFKVEEFNLFEVEVCRTSIRSTTISVIAKDENEAERLALRKAGDIEFPGEKDADYGVQSVTRL